METPVTDATVWKFKDPDGTARLVRIVKSDPAKQILWFIELNASRTATPKSVPYEDAWEIRQGAGFQELAEIPGRVLPPPREDWTATMIKGAARAQRIIEAALPMMSDLFAGPSERSSFFLRTAHRSRRKDSEVRQVMTRFLRGGQSMDATVPHTANCGGSGKPKPRVAPSITPTKFELAVRASVAANKLVARDLSAEDNTNIQEIIKEFLLTDSAQRKPIYGAYHIMVGRFYLANRNDVEHAGKSAVLLDHVPTYAQFELLASRALATPANVEKRAGSQYPLKNRPALKSPGRELMGPGSAFQIDSTTLDMEVHIGYQDNMVPVGERPTLYLVSDWWSTLIVGFCLYLGAPSRVGLGVALWSAAIRKDLLAAHWNLAMPPQGWNASGLPTRIITDRGLENTSLSVDQWAVDQQFIVSTLPRHRGDLKGVVDRAFGSTQRIGLDGAPAALSPEQFDRGLIRSAPAMTLPKARQLILEAIVENNHREKAMNTFDDRMQAAQLGRLTVQQYHDFGVSLYGVLPAADTVGDLTRRFLPSAQATVVKDKGISHLGVYYVPPESSLDSLFQRGVGGKKQKVRIYGGTGIVGEAWLYEGPNAPLRPLELRATDAQYANCSEDEVKSLKKAGIDASPGFDKQKLELKVTGVVRRETLIAGEKSERRAEVRTMKLLATPALTAAPESMVPLEAPVFGSTRPTSKRTSLAALLNKAMG
jgi:hypothetical protein